MQLLQSESKKQVTIVDSGEQDVERVSGLMRATSVTVKTVP